MTGEKCNEHSGCMTAIKNLEKTDDAQWKAIESIKGRINVVLGGVCMSCILLALNLLIK